MIFREIISLDISNFFKEYVEFDLEHTHHLRRFPRDLIKIFSEGR